MTDDEKSKALAFVIVNAIFWLAAVGAVTIIASLFTLISKLIS